MRLLEAMCWCGRSQIEIPVGWPREGRTGSCSYSGCGPGCLYVGDTEESQEEPIETDVHTLELVVGPGLCACGCTGAVRPRSRFIIGHDAKCKSLLVRAVADGLDLVLIDHDTEIREHVDPLIYAARFSGQIDWPTYIKKAAGRIADKPAPIETIRHEERKTA